MTAMTIRQTRIFDAAHFGVEQLVSSGEVPSALVQVGREKESARWRLGVWSCEFDIRLVNDEGGVNHFTVSFLPDERMSRSRAIASSRLVRGAVYGDSADESDGVLAFCNDGGKLLSQLEKTAQAYARKECDKLLKLLKTKN